MREYGFFSNKSSSSQIRGYEPFSFREISCYFFLGAALLERDCDSFPIDFYFSESYPIRFEMRYASGPAVRARSFFFARPSCTRLIHRPPPIDRREATACKFCTRFSRNTFQWLPAVFGRIGPSTLLLLSKLLQGIRIRMFPRGAEKGTFSESSVDLLIISALLHLIP